jgi:hypothetical protein
VIYFTQRPWPLLALNVEKGCPLKCRQLEDKRTSPRHRKSDVHDPKREREMDITPE